MKAPCPECEQDIEIEEPEVGEILDCAECGVELEVIGIDPLEFALISEDELDEWDDDQDFIDDEGEDDDEVDDDEEE